MPMGIRQKSSERQYVNIQRIFQFNSIDTCYGIEIKSNSGRRCHGRLNNNILKEGA